jgi:hypothetical protein
MGSRNWLVSKVFMKVNAITKSNWKCSGVFHKVSV